MSDRPLEKRDTGIYAILITILIFMFAQMGSAAYWAGGVKEGQQRTDTAVQDLKIENQGLRGEIRELRTAVARIEAQQKSEGEDKRR